jgi:hypothetical protein
MVISPKPVEKNAHRAFFYVRKGYFYSNQNLLDEETLRFPFNFIGIE